MNYSEYYTSIEFGKATSWEQVDGYSKLILDMILPDSWCHV